jgi:hypothetical protein
MSEHHRRLHDSTVPGVFDPVYVSPPPATPEQSDERSIPGTDHRQARDRQGNLESDRGGSPR